MKRSVLAAVAVILVLVAVPAAVAADSSMAWQSAFRLDITPRFCKEPWCFDLRAGVYFVPGPDGGTNAPLSPEPLWNGAFGPGFQFGPVYFYTDIAIGAMGIGNFVYGPKLGVEYDSEYFRAELGGGGYISDVFPTARVSSELTLTGKLPADEDGKWRIDFFTGGRYYKSNADPSQDIYWDTKQQDANAGRIEGAAPGYTDWGNASETIQGKFGFNVVWVGKDGDAELFGGLTGYFGVATDGKPIWYRADAPEGYEKGDNPLDYGRDQRGFGIFMGQCGLRYK